MPSIYRAQPTRGLIFILAALTAFGPLGTDMYLPALSQMVGEFGTTPGRIQATVSVFFLGLALGQIFYGPLSDRFGRKAPLLVGAVVYLLASLGCAWASDVDTFVVLRLLQALGGAAGLLIVRAIVNDLFDRTQVARVLSLMMMVMMLAPILAPLLGGWLVALLGWRSIFGLMAVYGLVCVGLTLWCLPESLPPARRQPLSLGGSLLTFRRLLSRRNFVVPALSAALAVSCMFAYITGSEFIFTQLYGLSPQHYGVLFAAIACGLILANFANRKCLLRWPVERILGAALLAQLVLAVVVVVAALLGASLPVFALLLAALIATLGFITANGAAVAMASSGRHAGSGSGLIGVLQFSCAFAVSASVAATQNGTVFPMVLAMLVCSGAASALWFAFRSR